MQCNQWFLPTELPVAFGQPPGMPAQTAGQAPTVHSGRSRRAPPALAVRP